MHAADFHPAATQRLQPIAFDALRDIHKGIRAVLFAVTAEAGRVDSSDDLGVVALEAEVRDVARLLGEHAGHEDTHFALTTSLADMSELVEQIGHEHAALEARMHWLVGLAGAARLADPAVRRFAVHELYVELASFTSAYLAHLDLEERAVMPALVERLDLETLVGIHTSINEGMSPEQFTRGLAVIFPAINVDDRIEMLDGIRATTPDDAFDHVVRLATSLLAPEDAADLARRLER